MKYRVAITVGCLIAACHSGETRDPVAIDPAEHNRSDSGSDAAGGGMGQTGGNGGTASSLDPDASGDPVGGDGDSGSNLTGDGDADIADASDAEVADAFDGGPRCGDGNTDLALDEECDDGNDQHSDGCEFDCKKTRIAQIALARAANCALSSGGGVKCWGQDLYGVLGRGTLGVDVSDPSQASVYNFGTTRRVTQVDTGRYHVCVLFDDGRARCWGQNEEGQLGNGSQENYGDEPEETLTALPDLPLTNIKSITAGWYTTCAISDVSGSDKVYCWGGNTRGEVGIASSADRVLSPGQPISLDATPKGLVGSTYVFCALLTTNDARCWGHYAWGMRGVGVVNSYLGDDEFPSNASHNVKGVPNPITQITGIHHATCALSGGDVYCWGRNDDANVGYPVGTYGTEIWQTPGKVNLGDVALVQVSMGTTYGCGLDYEGVVRCWGSNLDDGALGYPYVYRVGFDRDPVLDYELMRATSDGGITDAGDAGFVTPNLPLGAVDLGDFDDTPGLDLAIRVEASYNRTCAIMETGGLRCWGENSLGIVGYPESDYIGFTDSPAQAYQRIGYSDVNVFGPPADP